MVGWSISIFFIGMVTYHQPVDGSLLVKFRNWPTSLMDIDGGWWIFYELLDQWCVFDGSLLMIDLSCSMVKKCCILTYIHTFTCNLEPMFTGCGWKFTMNDIAYQLLRSGLVSNPMGMGQIWWYSPSKSGAVWIFRWEAKSLRFNKCWVK